jgi:hypothetical protein
LSTEQKKPAWAWTFGIIAILFNPFIPDPSQSGHMGSHRHCRRVSVDHVLNVSKRIEKASGGRLSTLYSHLDEKSADPIIVGSAMKKETKLTEREQLELQERRLDGEFDRRRLIRFGIFGVDRRDCWSRHRRPRQ